MMSVMNKIKSRNIYDKLNPNPTAEPELVIVIIIHGEITCAKTKHMQNKLVKCYRCKHGKSTWIIQGILTSIRYRYKMYKQLKKKIPVQIITKP